MKHAGPESLDRIEQLLHEIRGVPGLTEKSRGVFYTGSKAFLHFHEDPSGMHADVRLADDFVRYRVESPEEQQALLSLIGGSA